MPTSVILPSAVLRVLRALEREGYPAYVVGGCLRDAMRGVPPHDFDVATAATPTQMVDIFDRAGIRAIETGSRHGTVTALPDGEPIECTTYRLESRYSDGRHPDAVLFTDRIADDLARRDFTVNAMACRIPTVAAPTLDCRLPLRAVMGENAELVDRYDGQGDLAKGVLRCVGDPCRRFTEDALRILRCVRFSVQLGFSVEERTRAALRSCRDGLARISRERCAAEWIRMLECGMPLYAGLQLVREAGLWGYLLPEAGGEPTVAACARAALLRPDAALRMAALLRSVCDMRKADGPDAAALARRVGGALRLSSTLTRRTAALLEGSYAPLPSSDATLRRRMAKYGTESEDTLLLGALCAVPEDTVIAASARDCGSEALLSLLPPRVGEAVQRCAAIRARGDALTVSALALDGNALAQMGLQGKEIGAARQRLLEAVLDDPEQNTPRKLRALLDSRQTDD